MRDKITGIPPIINPKVNLSCNPTTEKTVENIGTKNRKLLATVAPPLRKLKNQSPNEPIEAGKNKPNKTPPTYCI